MTTALVLIMKRQGLANRGTHSFDVLAISALCKAVNESAGELPESLLITFLSKDWSTSGIPELR